MSQGVALVGRDRVAVVVVVVVVAVVVEVMAGLMGCWVNVVGC